MLDAAAGLVLGLFAWIGYRQLSGIDPFQARGTSGLFVCALTGGLLYRKRAKAVVWAIAGSIAFMILVIAYTPVIRGPAQKFIRADSLTSVDAVVVLASGVSDDQVLDQQGTDRMLTGLQLVKHRIAPNLVLSSITSAGSEETLYSMYDQVRLFKLAGSPANLIFTGFSKNTRDEALETRKIAHRLGWKRIALVTSPMHTKRACGAFEKAGMSVICVPALSRDVAISTLNRPQDRMRAFQLWLYETLATSEYQRRGWL